MSARSKVSPDHADRLGILLILAIGAFTGGWIAASGLIRALFRLIDPLRYPVALLADIPLSTSGRIMSATGDHLVVTTDRLSGSALWLLTTGDFLGALTIGAVTVSFAYVLWRIAQRRPFHRTMQVASLVAGCSLTFGSLLSQGIGGIGQMMAADDLNAALGGVALVAFDFQPLPVFLGFGIMALAYVFRAGSRLQRDTEGLV